MEVNVNEIDRNLSEIEHENVAESSSSSSNYIVNDNQRTPEDDLAIAEAITQIEKEISDPNGSSITSFLQHPVTQALFIGLVIAVISAKVFGHI